MTATLLVVLVGLAAPQPQERPSDEDARRLIAKLDRRLYVARDEGLSALAFTFRPEVFDASGESRGPGPFRVRYRWRKDIGDAVEFLDADGNATPVPAGGKEKERDVFLKACRHFRELFLGRSLADVAEDQNVRLERKRVNNREQLTLLLEARRPDRVRATKILLNREGLPWRFEKKLTNGWLREELHDYDGREEGFVLVSRQVVMTPPSPADKGFAYALAYTYQRSSGFIVPATIRKMGKDLPPNQRGTTVFESVAVNDDVPRFEPDRGR